ncbi:unnamed protein product [Boreogadus saida]
MEQRLSRGVLLEMVEEDGHGEDQASSGDPLEGSDLAAVRNAEDFCVACTFAEENADESMIEKIKTEDLLKRAEMKPLSEEWKMIGHILRQNRESDGNVAIGTGKEKKRKTYDNVKKDRPNHG